MSRLPTGSRGRRTGLLIRIQRAIVRIKTAETLVTSSGDHPTWSDMNVPRAPIFYHIFHDAIKFLKLTIRARLPRRYIRAPAFEVSGV
jgi:hypothetical protein